MKLWPVPLDLDEDFNMILSAEYKQKDRYGYEIVKLTIRNRHNGQQHKALQLISIKKDGPQEKNSLHEDKNDYELNRRRSPYNTRNHR